MANTQKKRNAERVRKCPQCGTMLGQKNICPVCNPQHSSDKANISQLNSPQGEVPVAPETVSDEYFSLTEQFVKEHLKNWNIAFDNFFVGLEKKPQGGNLNYRKLLDACKRWSDIFQTVQNLIAKSKNVITGDLMLSAMDELPAKYPEISEEKARELVRFFASIGKAKAPAPKAPAPKAAPKRTVYGHLWRKK